MARSSAVRPPAHAGTFYESNPDRLRREVRGYLDAVGDLPEVGEIRGLVAPHAGHVFSGPPAAHGYRLIEGADFGRVVLVGPSHREWFEGVAAWVGEAFETPLGKVPLDTGFTERLIGKSDLVEDLPSAHRGEHSLEVQLPFLQEVLRDWSLVPLLVAQQGWDLMRSLGEVLAETVAGDETPTVMIASSDLYHGFDLAECLASDRRCAEAIEAFDAEALLRGTRDGHHQACGAGPVAAVMHASRALGATVSRVLCLTNSSETFPSVSDRVVGYLSAVFHT